MEQVAANYLIHLAAGDLAAILSLFAPQAVVHSPLYGQRPAAEFYQALLQDTQASELTHLDTLTNPATQTVALYFRYRWRMATSKVVVFDCVDILRFGPSGQIQELRIIYDTAAVRPSFTALP